jgi:hypothetical protein
MNRLAVAMLVLLAVVGQVAVATAQAPPPPATSAPPPPTPTNLQRLPWWFTRPHNMPGMPWFYRPAAPPAQRSCRVVSWYPAQFSNTDQWGNTATWMGYAPQYACD